MNLAAALRVIWAVTKKELLDNMRDRKTVMLALVMPLLTPVGMGVGLLVAKEQKAKADAPEVALVGEEHGPELVASLRAAGVTFLPPPDLQAETGTGTLEDAVRKGKPGVALRIGPAFGEALRQGKPAPVEIIADKTRTDTSSTLQGLQGALLRYGQQVGATRLLLRGVDPSLLMAVSPVLIDVSSGDARSSILLVVLSGMLALFLLTGVLYVAIDVTAGERERGSIEALLLVPVPAWQIVTGKLVAVGVAGLLSLAVTVTMLGLILAFAPLEERFGFVVDVNTPRLVLAGLLHVPLAFTSAALMMLLGTFTKSFKTASSLLGSVVIVPALPGLIVGILPPESPLWRVVPYLGEPLLTAAIVRGDAVDLRLIGGLIAVNALVTAAMLAVTAKLFGPRLILGR